MARSTGALNKQHEARRTEILQLLMQRLSQADAMHASYRELATAAGVSISTMQHYFGKRADVVIAVLAESERQAAPYFAVLGQAKGDFATSVRSAIAFTRLGFEQFGVGNVYAMGLAEGLNNGVVGPHVVARVLEPSIAFLADRLRAHQAAGDMRTDADARHAAIMLLSPLIVLMLHQGPLGGDATHPADLDRFCADLADGFIRAHSG